MSLADFIGVLIAVVAVLAIAVIKGIADLKKTGRS